MQTLKTTKKHIKKRKIKNKIFSYLGLLSLVYCLSIAAILLYGIISSGYKTFIETSIILKIESTETPKLQDITLYESKEFIIKQFREHFPKLTDTEILRLFSIDLDLEFKNAIKSFKNKDQEFLYIKLRASSIIDYLFKNIDNLEDPKKHKSLIDIINKLIIINGIQQNISFRFFTTGDSSSSEFAGILIATLGTIFSVLIALVLATIFAIPIALYLSEFQQDGIINSVINININNLTAIPSIVWGMIGLTIIVIFEVPRSSPLIAGITLSFIAFPIIVINTKNAIKATSAELKMHALALGASNSQAIFHHVLPAATSSIMTGIVISCLRIAGETAPLIMIGMAAFISNVPEDIFSPFTTLTTQIYLWSSNPDYLFKEKVNAAVIILLIILLILNYFAILLREKCNSKY